MTVGGGTEDGFVQCGTDDGAKAFADLIMFNSTLIPLEDLS